MEKTQLSKKKDRLQTVIGLPDRSIKKMCRTGIKHNHQYLIPVLSGFCPYFVFSLFLHERTLNTSIPNWA